MSRLNLGAAVVLFAILTIGCAATPRAPEVPSSADSIGGVAFFDSNRNGIVDSGEKPAVEAEVTLGQGTDAFQTSASTDANGGFLVEMPSVGSSGLVNLFIQASYLAPGPAGAEVPIHFRQEIGALGDSEPTIIALPEVSDCPGTFEDVVADPAVCGEAQLPDLVPLVTDFGQPPTQPVAESSMRIDTTTESGKILLRFASATANLGAGMLHMIPDDSPSGESLATWQRVWTDDLNYVDRRTGEFVYHEGHGHFHLDAFEQYRLLDLDGGVVAVGEKISFCLVDSLRASPEATQLGFGVFVGSACQSAAEQQALNPGWTDYYGAGLDDQWIDITGVVAGDYVVEIVVDPDDLLAESDETNNRATFPITITSDALDS